jgi:prepilin-type N-terminal cleavage/methylation domain-containing protein
MRQRSWRRGYSLVEVLLAVTLLSTLLTAVGSSLVLFVNCTRANDNTIRARQAGNRALEYMLAHIRRAKMIELQDPAGPANAYHTLITLDVGEWDEQSEEWLPTDGGRPVQWTKFSFTEGQLRVTRLQGSFETVVMEEPILKDVYDLIFRSQRSGPYAVFRDVTVEMAIEVEDAFRDPSKILAFSVAGVASARSLVLLH